MTAYYNEHDPKSAAWLRELIRQGHIAPGDVDERSIEDVLPSELAGYTQCHFFAGIGIWSYALRQAGWPDDRPVWTGSCPCQPFSPAGKRGGFADERHLWPAFHWLISQRKPDVVFGEQVASKDGLAWLDTVQSDMEAAGYTFGALDLCAAGFGAPHIRQRLYFVADAEHAERRPEHEKHGQAYGRHGLGRGGNAGIPGDAESSERRVSVREGQGEIAELGGTGSTRILDFPISAGSQGHCRDERDGNKPGWDGESETGSITAPGPTNGFWSNAEWIYCRDGKYRPVEPVSGEVADGIAGDLGLVRVQSYPDNPQQEPTLIYAPLISKGQKRVMRLRGYGNAIVAPVAEAFIRAYIETRPNPYAHTNGAARLADLLEVR